MPKANTSTSASEISISFTLSQKPLETDPKLSLKPVAEKNDSTTLLIPGDNAIRAATRAKNTIVEIVEMVASRRRERRRVIPPGGPKAPEGASGPPAGERVSNPIPMRRPDYLSSGRSSVPGNHLAWSFSSVPSALIFSIALFTGSRSELPFSNRAPYCSFVVN